MRSKLREVAEVAAVSVSTASQALAATPTRRVAPETERRIRDAARQLNYQRTPSGSGERRVSTPLRTRKVGVILRVATYKFSDPFWSRVLDGLDAELNKHRYSIAFTLTVDELGEAHQQHLVAKERVGGFVLLGPVMPVPDSVDPARAVSVEGLEVMRAAGIQIDAVTIEKRWAMYQIVAHLARLQRRRIGFLGPSPDDDERGEAFQHALLRVGLPYDPALNMHTAWRVEGGYEATKVVLDRGTLPDALVCASDEIALGAMQAAREHGLSLPRDLAITGFDDLPFARSVVPALTTVKVPQYALGTMVARRIIERITDPHVPIMVQTLPTTLVVRASCGEEECVLPAAKKAVSSRCGATGSEQHASDLNTSNLWACSA